MRHQALDRCGRLADAAIRSTADCSVDPRQPTPQESLWPCHSRNGLTVSAIGWWVVIPIKNTWQGKSRMQTPPQVRRQLAVAMGRDTVRAAVGAALVHGVVVVGDGDDVSSFALDGVFTIVGGGRGMNSAIRAGARFARAQDSRLSVAAMPGDLPYLSSGELDAALRMAADHPVACVADRQGTGTTFLTARSDEALAPCFGDHSFSRHLSLGAVPLPIDESTGLRRDVDVLSDLDSVERLGMSTLSTLGAVCISTGSKSPAGFAGDIPAHSRGFGDRP
jgi:2-phospho-L-lactate guanylyltransferase